MNPRILTISGSLRRDSWNTKALNIMALHATQLGATTLHADLKSLSLPVYDEDLESAGTPESVRRFKAMIEESDLLFIASPEYNGSIPGGLKNAIDWASRGNNSFTGKVSAVIGASNGLNGTIRMQPHLRQVLSQLNVFVIPAPVVLIRNAADAFSPDGSLKDPKLHTQLTTLVERALQVTRALRAQ